MSLQTPQTLHSRLSSPGRWVEGPTPCSLRCRLYIKISSERHSETIFSLRCQVAERVAAASGEQPPGAIPLSGRRQDGGLSAVEVRDRTAATAQPPPPPPPPPRNGSKRRAPRGFFVCMLYVCCMFLRAMKSWRKSHALSCGCRPAQVPVAGRTAGPLPSAEAPPHRQLVYGRGAAHPSSHTAADRASPPHNPRGLEGHAAVLEAAFTSDVDDGGVPARLAQRGRAALQQPAAPVAAHEGLRQTLETAPASLSGVTDHNAKEKYGSHSFKPRKAAPPNYTDPGTVPGQHATFCGPELLLGPSVSCSIGEHSGERRFKPGTPQAPGEARRGGSSGQVLDAADEAADEPPLALSRHLVGSEGAAESLLLDMALGRRGFMSDPASRHPCPPPRRTLPRSCSQPMPAMAVRAVGTSARPWYWAPFRRCKVATLRPASSGRLLLRRARSRGRPLQGGGAAEDRRRLCAARACRQAAAGLHCRQCSWHVIRNVQRS
jgi:hypothetical protein